MFAAFANVKEDDVIKMIQGMLLPEMNSFSNRLIVKAVSHIGFLHSIFLLSKAMPEKKSDQKSDYDYPNDFT